MPETLPAPKTLPAPGEITSLNAAQIARGLREKSFTAAEVTEAFLARIDELDPLVSAFVTVTADVARAQAAEIDRKIAAGESVGPLAGVPIALKDNLCARGIETTCASKILRGFVPPYDATVVTKLRDAGAVLIGKANLDEFAMGSSTENSGFFPTKNPWDLSRVPGGSSGGSAAAVAANFAPIALGSDTGGSIRQPASFCGLVGFKPTYGRVSRYGLVAFASSLDQIGPLARTVEDAANLLSAISGNDPRDSTSVPRDVPDYAGALGDGDLSGLKIGVPDEYFADGIDPQVRASVLAAIGVLRGLGATIESCSLPHTEHALPVYYIVAPAEASSNLARFDGVRYGARARSSDHIGLFEKTRENGFGAEVKRRILIGTYALSAGYYDAFYHKAMQVRTLIQRDFLDAFSRFDAIVTPTAPTTAFRLGEKSDDPLAMKLSDICTLTANLAGIPAISQCCGFDTQGLPVGMQLMGPAFSEETLLKIAHAYEKATKWGDVQ